MKPLVPSNPGPPKDPNSFWAPWPVIREPCATRTIIGADSLTLEVFTLAPSVAFSGLASLVLGGRGRSSLRSIPETIFIHHPGPTPGLPLALVHWSVGDSRHFAMKLSEKSRRYPKGASSRHPNCPVGPFWPRITGRILARSVTQTPFQTVSSPTPVNRTREKAAIASG